MLMTSEGDADRQERERERERERESYRRREGEGKRRPASWHVQHVRTQHQGAHIVQEFGVQVHTLLRYGRAP